MTDHTLRSQPSQREFHGSAEVLEMMHLLEQALGVHANFIKKEKIISGKPKLLYLIQPVFFENNLWHLVNDGFIECVNAETNKSIFKINRSLTGNGVRETLNIIKIAAKNSNIVGADINELSPIKGFNSYNFLVAKLAYKILSYKFLY